MSRAQRQSNQIKTREWQIRDTYAPLVNYQIADYSKTLFKLELDNAAIKRLNFAVFAK